MVTNESSKSSRIHYRYRPALSAPADVQSSSDVTVDDVISRSPISDIWCSAVQQFVSASVLLMFCNEVVLYMSTFSFKKDFALVLELIRSNQPNKICFRQVRYI